MEEKKSDDTKPVGYKNLYSRDFSKLSFTDFIHRFQIQICIGFGMIGFIYSIIIVAAPKTDVTSPYCEIILRNKVPLVDSLLNWRIKALKDTISKVAINDKGATNKTDNSKKSTAIQVLKRTLAEKYALEYGKTDTGLAVFNQYIYPDRKSYLQKIGSGDSCLTPGATVSIPGFLIDTCQYLAQVPIKYPVTFNLEKVNQKSILDFVTKYPQFGLWIVITIAQMTLWFLLFPLLTGNILTLQSKFNQSYQISIRGILTNSVVPLAFISIFLYCLFKILADTLLIRDDYFLSSFNTRMIWYATPGYLVATYGFGSYISIARQIDMVDKNGGQTLLQPSDQNVNELYLSLKKAFDNAFLASAIILSLFVIWSGITFNAINSLEIIRFYKNLSGRTLIPGDLIYLIGLLHTCILLTFYLPVKLKFNSLKITKDTTDPAANGGQPNNSIKNIFSTLSDYLGPLLVTTSPIIASLIHVIFSALQK